MPRRCGRRGRALQAGLIAVPLSVPTGGIADDRVSSVLRDASPSVILTTSAVVGDVSDYAKPQSGESAAAIVDLEFLQQEVFRQLPKQDGALTLVVTRNTAFYAMGDATVCCSWGTHGVDRATGNSFVLASYLSRAPAVITDKDVPPALRQRAELMLQLIASDQPAKA